MSSVELMERIHRYAATVQGTRQYWYQRYQELRALVDQKGAPTFLWTLRSADNCLPELHRLMPQTSNASITHSMRVQAVVDNPHITNWFFTAKVEDFVSHWLQGVMKAEWYWYRFGYQSRGSTHVHGCCRLLNNPCLCQLVQKSAKGWLIQRHLDQSEPINEELLGGSTVQVALQESKDAKAAVTAYADWLVTTMNDSLAAVTAGVQGIIHPHVNRLLSLC